MDLRDDQQVALKIQPAGARGPAKVEGTPVWASSDATVVTVVPASDGLSAMAFGVSAGVARVVVTAKADLGSGLTPLTGSFDFNVVASAASEIAILAATPANQ